ncbi:MULTISPECIES: response regulator transcription factor [unclassified Streptomyces]|uniref:response regulator transcription factor n=1 Tax=unclassified Streptomyces TaxID=2593676 RepID=UPI0036EC5076
MSAPVQAGPSHSGGGSVPSVRTYPSRAWTDPRTYITARERQVLVLAANGNTNQAIARRLGVGVENVKSRVQSILRKLRVSDRAQAVAVALKVGLISLEDVDIPTGANRGYEAHLRPEKTRTS